MTTNDSATISRRGIVGMLLMASVIATAIGLCSAASLANAGTPGIVGVGTKILPLNEEGGCVIAIVTPTKAATAGHCGRVGDKFTDGNGNFIGTVSYSTTHTNGVGDGHADYAIITLAPGTIIRNEASVSGAVGAPYVGAHVRKHGHGIGNAVEQPGTIVAATQYGVIMSGMAVTPFDSGSPIISDGGAVVGILSGSPTFIDAILNAARALDIPVPAGASVATRADIVQI